MSDSDKKDLSRRQALAKLGGFATVGYFGASLTTASAAWASSDSSDSSSSSESSVSSVSSASSVSSDASLVSIPSEATGDATVDQCAALHPEDEVAFNQCLIDSQS